MAQNLAEIDAEYRRGFALLPGELNDDDFASLIRCCRAKGTALLHKYDSRRRLLELNKPNEMRRRSGSYDGGAYTAEKQTYHFDRPAQYEKAEFDERVRLSDNLVVQQAYPGQMTLSELMTAKAANDPASGIMIVLELNEANDFASALVNFQLSLCYSSNTCRVAERWDWQVVQNCTRRGRR